jgi:outer membrane receptor protein involved in Fe transport
VLNKKALASYKIIMKPDGKLLEGVTITAQKKLIERKADRTVFNVESSITSTGSDAFDVLQKAPGVQVNNGNVGIAGKSSVSIMINDRLMQVNGSELESMLRSMSAADISKIEVITTPPAKYDAEGNSGIINIITKKSVKNGFNGNLTLTYDQRTKGTPRVQGSFNYRNGNLNVYGNSNLNYFRFISQQQTNTQYPEQQQQQRLDQNNRPLYTWSQVGADYNLSPKSVLGLLYTHGTMDTKRDENLNTRYLYLPGHTLDSLVYTDAFATDRGRRNVINLNYDWKIDSSGKKFSLNADYFTRQGNNTRNFITKTVLPDGTATGNSSDNHTFGKQNTDIISTRLDLEWPTTLVNLAAGARASWIHNYSDNVFTYLSGSDYINDVNKTNTFDYKENTQAMYVNAKKDWGKWSAQLGLRAEYTQTTGHSVTLNQTNTNSYFKIFPTAYLQYQPSDDHSWNINYSRRINRPSFWDMNPFRRYTTATAYEAGNPFLQPSFGNNIELGYAFKSMLAFTVFVNKVDEYATRVSFIDTLHNTFHFSQANAGNSLHYGVTGTLNISPLPWWENSTGVYLSYNKFSSSFYGQEVSYGRPAFYLEISNTFMLNKSQTLAAELGFDYDGRSQDDFDIEHSSANLSAGIKALFFSKKLTVALSAEDILKTDIWQMSNQYNGTYQRAYYDSRLLRLSLTWKFGNQSIKDKRQRNTNLEESSRSN